MKKFTVCLAVLLIAMMVGTSAWSYDRFDHVKAAPNAKGDLLFFPWYFADGNGYATKISIINTSPTLNVVAKVVYRSYIMSYEVLDHLIYLSPNDVWTGTVTFDGTNAVLHSTDDSILVSDGVFASETNPVNKAFGKTYFKNDANNKGYIECIEAASVLYAPVTNTKQAIYAWYKNISSVDITNTNRPANVLTGYQESITPNGQTLKQAKVFAEYRNQAKLVVGANTNLGLASNNTLAELEAAMCKHDVALPYVANASGDMTMHIFNFPTKHSSFSAQSNGTVYKANPYSPYWSSVVYQCEYYTRNLYDLMENTPSAGTPDPVFSPVTPPDQGNMMCLEMEEILIGYNAAAPLYTEGWIRYNWGNHATTYTTTGFSRNNDSVNFTGTPVLATALYQTGSGNNWAEADSAHTDGSVQVPDSAYPYVIVAPYYQYSDLLKPLVP